jgi:hypothetical protein
MLTGKFANLFFWMATLGDDDEDSPKSRTGRFFVPHRGGTRVEVGEPIHVGGERPWLCAVKLLGRDRTSIPLPVEDLTAPEPTQTLLVRTGRGSTPEEAQRDAMAQLTLVYGSPVEPPPAPKITQKKTDPPPPMEDDEIVEEPPKPKKKSFFARLFSFWK